MRNSKVALALPLMFGLCAAQAHAGGLTIVPTYDSTITSLSNAATIESTIQSAIDLYQADFSNPVTVKIDFSNANTGLGQSSFNFYYYNYNTYRSALIADKAMGTDNTAFLASLPASGNPVPTQSASRVEATTALGRALGFNTPGVTVVNGQNYDGQISLNTAITNVSRTGAQSSTKYDLQAVVEHEIDEVLGFNSDLDAGFPANIVGPSDFFRYSSNGVRSFSKSSTVDSYFSIDGGQTAVDQAADGVGVHFEQSGNGDYHDFKSYSAKPITPRVQDAFAYYNDPVDLGTGEFTALDVIGYNRTNSSPAPEPAQVATLSMIGLGLGGLLLCAHKRKAGEPTA